MASLGRKPLALSRTPGPSRVSPGVAFCEWSLVWEEDGAPASPWPSSLMSPGRDPAQEPRSPWLGNKLSEKERGLTGLRRSHSRALTPKRTRTGWSHKH